MSWIHYLSDDAHVEVSNNETILQTSLRAGISHAHACGGYARCSTCRVLIVKGLEHCAPRNSVEQKLAERLHFDPTIRLACQTNITGDITLRRLALDAEDIELTSQLKIGAAPHAVGQEKRAAILFANIRGFTNFVENQLPYDVVHVLNRYFYEMDGVLNRNGGHIDSYMGGGFLASFSIEDSTIAALQATKAGLEMLEVIEGFKPYLQTVYKTSLDIGIGIHYGDIVVGTIGTTNKKQMMIIGDAVNLANRIESANKKAGTRLLISKDTYRQIRNLVQIGKQICITFKDKQSEYMLYEIIGINHQLSIDAIKQSPVVTSSADSKPKKSNEFVIAMGSVLLGVFLTGFLTELSLGRAPWILIYTFLGAIGTILLFWEFLLRDNKAP